MKTYIIKCGNFDLYKIGKSEDPAARLYRLQTGRPWDLSLESVLDGDVEKRLRDMIWDTCKEKDWQIIALEIMPDHVHLFVNVLPDIAARQVAAQIKGRSSRYLRFIVSTFTEIA